MTDSLAIARMQAGRRLRPHARLGLGGLHAAALVTGVLLTLHGSGGADPLVPFLMFVALTSAVIASRRLTGMGESGARPHLRDLKTLFASDRYRLLLIAAPLHWACCAPYNSFFGILLHDRHLPPVALGVAFCVGVAGEMLIFVRFARLRALFELDTMLAIAFAGSAIRWLLISQVTSIAGDHGAAAGALPDLRALLGGGRRGRRRVGAAAAARHRAGVLRAVGRRRRQHPGQHGDRRDLRPRRRRRLRVPGRRLRRADPAGARADRAPPAAAGSARHERAARGASSRCRGWRWRAPAGPPTGKRAPEAAGAKPGAPAAAILRAPAPPADEPARFVLVRAGAVLHTALPPAGRRVRLPALVIESDSPQAAARFRLVRAAGDWVELETATIDPEKPHCHAPPAAFAGLALRLFASAADLQPVTIAPDSLALEGGGAVELEPGVPRSRERAITGRSSRTPTP